MIALLVLGGVVVHVVLDRFALGAKPEVTLDAFVADLYAARDGRAWEKMSARYQAGHDATVFTRRVAELSKLRSATGVAVLDRASDRLQNTERSHKACAILVGVTPSAYVAATLVKDGGWRIDALAVDGKQLDEGSPADVRYCATARGWRP